MAIRLRGQGKGKRCHRRDLRAAHGIVGEIEGDRVDTGERIERGLDHARHPERIEDMDCQTAFKRDPRSASKRDPLFR